MRIDSRAGPYEEGGSLEVTCVVYGGKYGLRASFGLLEAGGGGEGGARVGVGAGNVAVIAVAWRGEAALNEHTISN